MTKKKLTAWLAGFAGIAAAIIATKGGGHKPAPAPPNPDPRPSTYTLTVHVFRGPAEQDHKAVGAPVISGDVRGVTDSSGNVNLDGLPAGERQVCASAVDYKPACAPVTMPRADLDLALERDVRPAPPIAQLSTDGPIFLAGGQPWRWKGVTAFALLDRFAKGEDISGFLEDVRGFNVLRVFTYVGPGWGAQAWDSPSPDVVIAFLKRVERDGFYVEITLLTDDDPARLEPARRLVEALKAARPPNLVLEAGNEPTTNKTIDTHALRAVLAGSGFLYSSGDYEDSARFYGSYLTTHTARDGDWPRRAHDLLEFYQGGGPNAPSDPAHRLPIVADEPIRPDQAGFNEADFRGYFGACALLGAGATYHFDSGKFGRRLSADERRIAAVVLGALEAFPPDAPKGPYTRPVERSLRTYQVGPWMVRVRPETANYEAGGWVALEPSGILWRKQ